METKKVASHAALDLLPGDTQIVLVLSYLSTLGLNDWLLAGGGLEALFAGMKEGHGM